jgi:hypothetical protein
MLLKARQGQYLREFSEIKKTRGNISMAKITAEQAQQEAKSFLGSLFDFSFSVFITTKLIKFLFGTVIIIGAIFGLGSIIGAFSKGVLPGLIALIIAPLLYLLGVVIMRIWLEFVIVIFKIEENTRA